MVSLKKREKMLSLIYNSTSDMMFLLRVDIDNSFIYNSVNQRFAEFIGIPQEKCVGKKFEEIFIYDNSYELMNSFHLILLNKKNNKNELCLIVEKSLRYFSVDLIPILDEYEECEYILCIAQDITGWKMREDELIKVKKQAEESNRLKSALLSNMSHEVRTPLHGILGLAGIMHEELLHDEHKKMADDIGKAGKRLLNTLHSIIELSMLEAEERNVNYAKIGLSEVINDIFEKYKIEAELKGLYLELVNNSPDLKLHIDRLLFIEILSHLLDNAIKFTNCGGIKLLVENIIESSNNFVVIKVIDTGIGISKKNIQNIFSEFIQESEGYGRSHEGMGLGLTLVKKMTKLMNGEINVESEKDRGSTFVLKFPAISDSIKYVEDKKSVEIINNSHSFDENYPLVLLVEDNDLNSKLTTVFLKNLYKVEHVSDATSALQKIEEKTYDAILMDINLGEGINGVDAANEIRKNEKYKDVPIIAMTGYALNKDKENFIETGFSHYIAKPFTKKQLIELMNEIYTPVTVCE
jgi:PAS domain S-box-containing protein